MPEDREELLDQALHQARSLVKTEIQLARRELSDVVTELGSGAAFLGGAAALALVGLTGMLVSLGLSLDDRPARGPFLLSALALAGASSLAVFGKRALPAHPLGRVSQKLSQDLSYLQRH